MLKAELIALVAQQRAEISRLQTQLAAMQARPSNAGSVAVLAAPACDRKAAIARLAERFPERKSFTADEVRAAMA